MSQTPFVKLPSVIQNKTVSDCIELLKKKKATLFVKRVLDIVVSLILIVLLAPLLIITTIAVVVDTGFPILFCQPRIGRDGREFKILKFRTMVKNAEKLGTQVTKKNDDRITAVGKLIRKVRIDELMQLFNVLKGDMSIIGPRPEVSKYVERYKPEYYATLLVRPGLSCRSSIAFANESEILGNCENVDEVYVDKILPGKCEMNIEYVKNLSIIEDVRIFFATIANVFR